MSFTFPTKVSPNTPPPLPPPFHWFTCIEIINCWKWSLVSSLLDVPANAKAFHILLCPSKVPMWKKLSPSSLVGNMHMHHSITILHPWLTFHYLPQGCSICLPPSGKRHLNKITNIFNKKKKVVNCTVEVIFRNNYTSETFNNIFLLLSRITQSKCKLRNVKKMCFIKMLLWLWYTFVIQSHDNLMKTCF